MAFGWFKSNKKKNKTPDGAYLSGIDLLVDKDTDRAIEELVKLAKVNPDTAETYLALGNLFRAKGDTERAIQVHRTLIHRSDIDNSLRTLAKFNLALDFRKAGLIERAISAFEEVLSTQSDHLPSIEALVELHEESHEWTKAMNIQEKISKLKKEDFKNVIAHHLTELGKQLESDRQTSSAIKMYRKAISQDANCLDAYLHLGDLYLEIDKPEKAIDTWQKVLDIQSDLGHLTYPRMEKAYRKIGKEDKFENLLLNIMEKEQTNLYARLALSRIWLNRGEVIRARNELERILKKQSRFWEARLLLGHIIIETKDHDKALEQYSEIIDIMTPTETNFQCMRCGYEAQELVWKCPRCRAWDTITLKPFLGSARESE